MHIKDIHHKVSASITEALGGNKDLSVVVWIKNRTNSDITNAT